MTMHHEKIEITWFAMVLSLFAMVLSLFAMVMLLFTMVITVFTMLTNTSVFAYKIISCVHFSPDRGIELLAHFGDE